MTHKDIIESAVTLAGEMYGAAGSDYSLRSFPILASIYNQCDPLDRVWRESNNLPESTWIPCTKILDQDEDFPLSDAFLAPVPYALAALLTLDENPELSKLLYAKYVEGLAEIRKRIPAKTEKIVDRYHFD